MKQHITQTIMSLEDQIGKLVAQAHRDIPSQDIAALKVTAELGWSIGYDGPDGDQAYKERVVNVTTTTKLVSRQQYATRPDRAYFKPDPAIAEMRKRTAYTMQDSSMDAINAVAAELRENARTSADNNFRL